MYKRFVGCSKWKKVFLSVSSTLYANSSTDYIANITVCISNIIITVKTDIDIMCATKYISTTIASLIHLDSSNRCHSIKNIISHLGALAHIHASAKFIKCYSFIIILDRNGN